MELNDTQLAQQLVGTWTTYPPDGDVVSTATYEADGTGTELVQIRDGSERSDLHVGLLWSVKDGILSLRAVETSDERLPVGLELKSRIISVSEEKFVSQAYQGYGWGDGEQIVKTRVV